MLRNLFSPNFLLALIAVAIVGASLWYTQYLSRAIALEQKQVVENWVEAQKTLLQSSDTASLNLAAKISAENTQIPIVETDEKGRLTGQYINLDSNAVKADSGFLRDRLSEFKAQHPPLELVISESPFMANRYYYGESKLQKEVRYYPLVQLVVIALFITMIIVYQRTRYNSAQNQVWAGLAKETAHQLGTPLTSMQGWAEMLRELPGNEAIVTEMQRDLLRLQLISERFSKIGSTPKLELSDVRSQVGQMVEYMRKRASGRVKMEMQSDEGEITALLSPSLFDWVIENLLKNALDAMDGKGQITVRVMQRTTQVLIDVSDTGKGIPAAEIKRVFKAGFTTKKRGWGLGLTLCRRIIEQYHKGEIFVKRSEPGKGTTFRIVLNKT